MRTPSLLRRRTAAAVVTIAVAAAVSAAPIASGYAATTTVKPVVAGTRYLALGDSIAFGYRESTNLPTPDYSNAASFRGYPEILADTLGLRLTNAACPGETATSLIDDTAQSNGCESYWDSTAGVRVDAGYRTAHPLHVDYTGSQLHFARQFLRAHPATRLVTLTVGANDAFLCQGTTDDGCVSEFSDLRAALQANVGRILRGLRATGYAGQIAVVAYYSLDYSNALLSGEVRLLNEAIAAGATPYGAIIVSGYDAYAAAAAQDGGDVCAARLVTALTDGTCGAHPSVSGATMLAQAVAHQVKKR